MKPLKLTSTRVWRVYTGGKLLDKFQGKEECIDDFFPEEWVGSTTEAVNEGRENLIEGLAACEMDDGTSVFLKELISNNPAAFLGEKHIAEYGSTSSYLVKLLDSSVRLPVQSHPDRDFSKKYLNADYGKTESWIILGGRNIDCPPYVLFGFKDCVTESDYRKAYEEQDVDAMTEMLNRVEVKEGDCFVIPGGVPHAIGSGVFLLEVQEPSDFVFQLDRKGPCWNLSDFQVHMDLGDDKMFEAFDFDGDKGEAILKRCLTNHNFTTPGITELLPEWIHPYFNARSICLTKTQAMKTASIVIGICAEGNGKLVTDKSELNIKQGETFVIPAACGDYEYICESERLRVFETLPPAS
ncbi:MAG: class I mannose-6-phosphate isomerase [Planctomycetota bacterium]|jgi:mannose-6-phosphate isomerase